jgi:putative ABC transport system ATP-binding protein
LLCTKIINTMPEIVPVLKAESVHKSFKVGVQDVEVLKDVNMQVLPGDFAIIFGPSGSGKSTLLHTILGLEPPTTGHVYFLGKDLYEGTTEDMRSDERKKHVGMVYQQPNWVKSLSVVENVAFPLSLLGMDRTDSLKLAWKSLESLSMQNWVNYFPAELSGGQQQRVALARALVTNPEVIIADEPTGNLDYESGQMLMQLMTKLHEQGKTIVMVTHDLEYMSYARTAIQFLDGKIVGVYTDEQKEELVRVIKTKKVGV